MKFPFLPLLIICLTLIACKNDRLAGAEAVEVKKITGETMGTYYAVTFVEGEERLDATQLKKQIDSTLIALNAEVSNWEKNSTVVRFNESEQGISVVDAKHFLANFKLAQSASLATGGAFEPTILPLTDYWGFGSGRERIEAGVDTAEVMRRLALVDINKIELVGDTFLRKAEPGVRLDLGGSAKGYGVDLIANFLQAKGIEHLFVEIGGEVFASGMRGDRPWRAGVNLPEEGAAFNAIAETMSVNNQGVATSGNYRNYYKVGAETYSHTLNPKTGFPERNSLLSASVLAPNCATADAFATACMVLGPDAALTLIESRPELEAYFLVRTENGEMEPRFSSGLGL